MLASDPHKGESIDIKSYLDTGWELFGYVNGGTIVNIDIGDDGREFIDYGIGTMGSYHSIVKDRTMFTVENVYLESIEQFCKVFFIPPFDGVD